jgi:pyruvate,water dikinase
MNKDSSIIWFENLGIEDVPQVGGKNAALGEMYVNLRPLGVNVPNGFAITASAYRSFLARGGLDRKIAALLKDLDTKNIADLQRRGRAIRRLIVAAELPRDLAAEIFNAYRALGKLYGADPDVAVRSSATAEDLPGASFAGQQETYLNVRGNRALEESVKKCFASLFTDRAISYRVDKGFAHESVALSIGVQKMVRADIGASGVAFTLDPETGFDKVVVINAIWGLGEMIVQGKVVPDEFIVFKPTRKDGFRSLIAKNLGDKRMKLVYGPTGTKAVAVPAKARVAFSLSDDEALAIADWCVKIEEHFSRKRGSASPMDIEWAKDGKSGELFIVQARPETVHAVADKTVWHEYRLKGKGRVLACGAAVGTKIASGAARFIRNPKRIGEFQKGEVLVTEMTDPDWEPIMKIASAIVTDKGGRTSHAAIVSRELGIPCIVGTGDATSRIPNGKAVTVDCSSGAVGTVYQGKLPFEMITHRLDTIPDTQTKIMVNIGSPDEAFRYHYLPAKGVGLGRVEFVIAEHIKIHPNALIGYRKLKDRTLRAKIEKLTPGYNDKAQFYVDKLAEGIAKIGAAFWPHEVIIRFSDFKTNEYRALLGGNLYEPEEENPMLGWRGASRYYDPKFTAAFGLECRAIQRVRDEFGLKNVVAMVPFCRTPEEGERVLTIMAAHGLDRKADPSLKVYVMCEIPSNVALADRFLDVFDGMSIGSNDLTQLVMGLDRDSGIVSRVANENNLAVKKMIALAIKKCRERGKYIGICGQAPSDYPEFTEFLVAEGIGSISLNPDTVIKTIGLVAEKEREVNRTGA